jgi:hypothetical protein
VHQPQRSSSGLIGFARNTKKPPQAMKTDELNKENRTLLNLIFDYKEGFLITYTIQVFGLDDKEGELVLQNTSIFLSLFLFITKNNKWLRKRFYVVRFVANPEMK